MLDKRVSDSFRHLAIAVCLAAASHLIANIYSIQVQLAVPLPPYPGTLIEVPRLRLV